MESALPHAIPGSVLRFAFGRGIEASFSTIDIGGILSNVANKFLLEGFFSVERTWRNITAVRNVSDFKTVTSYRLVGKDQYELVAPGGELKHGTLGEEKYENRADTYGLVLSIDRRDIINDDLGAITTVPRKLGRGSGLKIDDVFWTTFLFLTVRGTVEKGSAVRSVRIRYQHRTGRGKILSRLVKAENGKSGRFRIRRIHAACEALARRKPMLLLRLAGTFRFRLLTAQLAAVLFQLPPRFKRSEAHDRSPAIVLAPPGGTAKNKRRLAE